MDAQDVLERSIKKAIENGWKPWFLKSNSTNGFEVTPALHVLEHFTDEPENWPSFYYPEIIFNHDFARALWGEYGYVPDAKYTFKYKENSGKERTLIHTTSQSVSPWQYHLQNMVISEDPIEYLGENLGN